MELKISGGSNGANISIENYREHNGVTLFDLQMTLGNDTIPEPFIVSFTTPDIDVFSVWSPSIGADW